MPHMSIGELDVHYVDQGEGDVLLLCPENLHAASAYEGEIDYFSERVRVIAFDYPGTGQSTRERLYEDERIFDQWNFWADLASHLLLDLGVKACTVMGAGYGAWVALHFAGKQAALHRLDVQGVIADSFLAQVDSRTLHRSLDMREHYYVRRVEWLRKQHGEDWREVVDADTAYLRLLADRGGYAVPDFVLNSIHCPVLLTGTLHDALTPGIAQEFARISSIVPDCSLYLASESHHRYGDEHPLLWTAPDVFRAVADLFLSRLSDE